MAGPPGEIGMSVARAAMRPNFCRSNRQAALPTPAVRRDPAFCERALWTQPPIQRDRFTDCPRSLTGETPPVRRDPFMYELREKSNALGLARFALCEDPESPVHVKVGTRHAFELRIGIADEAR